MWGGGRSAGRDGRSLGLRQRRRGRGRRPQLAEQEAADTVPEAFTVLARGHHAVVEPGMDADVFFGYGAEAREAHERPFLFLAGSNLLADRFEEKVGRRDFGVSVEIVTHAVHQADHRPATGASRTRNSEDEVFTEHDCSSSRWQIVATDSPEAMFMPLTCRCRTGQPSRVGLLG